MANAVEAVVGEEFFAAVAVAVVVVVEADDFVAALVPVVVVSVAHFDAGAFFRLSPASLN